MASRNDGYWSRSWDLLTRESGWFKPILVLAAARLVPIVGPFGADGYALEWARLTSWGVDSAPKQRNVDIGGCIRTGARAFVVMLGYALALGIVNSIFQAIFGQALGGLVGFALSLTIGLLIIIAQVRSAIYQTIGSGYQVNRIFDMVKRDTDGILRILGMEAILAVVAGFIGGTVVTIIILTSMGDMFYQLASYGIYGYTDEYEVVRTVFLGLGKAMPALCVSMFFMNIIASMTSLLTNTAVGLWLRQFDVQNWGDSADPLPSQTPGSAQGYAASPYGSAAYPAPGADSAPAQSQYGASATPYTQPTNAYPTAQQQVETFGIPQAHEVPTVIEHTEQPPAQAPVAQASAAQAPAVAPVGEEPAMFALSEEPATFSLAEEPVAAPAQEVSLQQPDDMDNPAPFVLAPPMDLGTAGDVPQPIDDVAQPVIEEPKPEEPVVFTLDIEPTEVDVQEPVYDAAPEAETQMEAPVDELTEVADDEQQEAPVDHEGPAEEERIIDEFSDVVEAWDLTSPDEVPTFSLTDEVVDGLDVTQSEGSTEGSDEDEEQQD